MRRNRWIILGLGVLCAAVFWRVSLFEFVSYDDTDYVTRNTRVQAGLTVDGIAWAFGRIHGEATYWHPLTWLSHMLDCQLFGLKPAGPHLVNLLWHTASVVLLFLVFRRMTGAVWRSAMLAALFAVHPIQVESVAWIAERKNVLSTFFWMVTLGAYGLYAEKPGPWRYAAVLVSFALGLMAKPMLVTLPCVLLLLDFWPLRRFSFSSSIPRDACGTASSPTFVPAPTLRLVAEKLPLFALALGIGVVTIQAHAGLGMTNFNYGLTPGMQAGNALVSYVRYLGKVLCPTSLSVLYFHPGKWPDWIVGAALFTLIVLSGLALRDWRRFPYLAVGWLWFLGTLLPVIGFIQVGVQAMANRFAYVPAIGLFLMAVWGVADAFARWKLRPSAVRLVAAAVLTGCLAVSSYHLGHWKNSRTLFEYALRVDPKNMVAHNNLAFSMLEEGQLEGALDHAREALRIRSDFSEAHYLAGAALDALKKPAEATPHLREAARLAPDWALPRLGLARILARQGQVEEAIAEYDAGLRLFPGSADAHAELASLLAREQRTADAIHHYREAVRLRPDVPEVLNNFAWLRATHRRPEFRDGAEAVILGERACELTKRQRAVFIGTLAAAYAEAGRFDDAVRAAELARQVAEAAGEKQIAETNTKLLELYRAGKPCREEPAAPAQ